MREHLTLPEETVEVPVLGTVTVRGMRLSERLRYMNAGASTGDAGSAGQALNLLAGSVMNGDGGPVWDPDGWDVYGALHQDAVLELVQIARRVNGLGTDDPKE